MDYVNVDGHKIYVKPKPLMIKHSDKEKEADLAKGSM
jgi:hypothetical protein